MSIGLRNPRPGRANSAGVPGDDELWRTLNARLAAFVRRRIGDPHAAEDVAQDVLLCLHRALGDLRDRDRLDAFAYQVARNAIIDHYRSTAGAKELPSAPDDLVAWIDVADPIGAEPEAVADTRELVLCLQPLVRRLPDRYREALRLTDLGELSQVQATQVVGLSSPGMKARVQRGRAHLHTLLTRCCAIALDHDRRVIGFQRSGPCACDDA
jgi:RNA polymerase sigma-70 factor, ECF subfamily